MGTGSLSMGAQVGLLLQRIFRKRNKAAELHEPPVRSVQPTKHKFTSVLSGKLCVISAMGNVPGSLLGGGTNPALDQPDPDTGLTPREKMAVRRIWDIVKADTKQNGVELLVMFFEANPSYQKHFKSFKNVPFKDLPRNPKFQAHCTSVMYALTSIVDNLDDTGCLVEMLTKLGQNHHRHGISRQEFLDLKITVLKLLKKKLGLKFTTDDEAAWSKTLDVAYSVIFKGLDKSQESGY